MDIYIVISEDSETSEFRGIVGAYKNDESTQKHIDCWENNPNPDKDDLSIIRVELQD